MPFGIPGAVRIFQKAIDMILKPVLGRFVMVYMDDVIFTSSSFDEDIDHLNQNPEQGRRNYRVTERECLAVIWALNKFKTYFGSLPEKVIPDHAALRKLTNGKNLSCRMIRWALKLSEFNIEWEHRPGVRNVVANVLSRNPIGNMDGSQISCSALRALALNSREQLIQEQREDPELGHIYRFLENPDDVSVNATVCEEEIRRGERVQYVKARETRSTHSKRHSAAEGRPVLSRQMTTVRPCPYYLRSSLKDSDGIPEEQRSTGINSLPQNSLRKRSLSMEALDGDPADRSELRKKNKITVRLPTDILSQTIAAAQLSFKTIVSLRSSSPDSYRSGMVVYAELWVNNPLVMASNGWDSVRRHKWMEHQTTQ
ncbi:retrovirus-related Pol polyprotein from transposon 297 [Trichonephila clavipes]|uniref:Retrovirus-related Pol polyprotein from transposon 297 n=1 Tax=Trichonephila clavipes TaxID=2585209 RepID=A0A8X6SJZ2_TRICX|nr:retrovirus-related Pol polyprotein from transposon 297 [Trichonephila clavipes]